MRHVLAIAWLAACRYDPLPRLSGDGGSGDGLLVDAPAHTSCSGLPATCGTGADCCLSTFINGGSFYRNYDKATDGLHNTMTYTASVSGFTLDTFEVTVGRFRAFVEANMGTQTNPPVEGAGGRLLNGQANAGGWSSGWNASLVADKAQLAAALACSAGHQTWTDPAGPNETLPINCVTWYEAEAFCIWDGGFLPTELQWNYAAADGGNQAAYPWSNPPGQITIDCTRANYQVSSGTYCVPTTGNAKHVGNESPLGDVQQWTVADLAGNVAEWTLDYYATLTSPQYPNPCINCALLVDAGLGRASRGGSYVDLATGVRGASRTSTAPATRAPEIGFRCAR